MPVIVPIALLITHWWKEILHRKKIIGIGLIFPFLAFIIFITATVTDKKEYYLNSDKYLIEKHLEENLPIYHWEEKSYSGQFYTKGNLKVIKDTLELKEHISSKEPFLIIIPNKKIKNIYKEEISLLQKLDSNYNKSIYLFKD